MRKKAREYSIGAKQLFLSKTAQHTYLVFLGNGLAIFFAFLFTIVLVRILSIEDFGYFSALWSFLILVAEIVDVGIGNSLSQFLPTLASREDKLKSFLKTAFFFQCAVLSFVCLGILLFASVLSDIIFHNKAMTPLLSITVLGIIGLTITNFFIFVFSARQKFLFTASITAGGGLFRLLFFIVLFVLASVTLPNVIWIQTIGFLGSAIMSLFLVGPGFLTEKMVKEDLRKLVSFSSFIGIARALTAVVGRVDVLMLIALTTPYETGVYATASRIIAVYPLFAGSFLSVIAPKVTLIRSSHELAAFIKKVIIATAGIISSIVILILIAHPFLRILFGEKALAAVGVFRLLLVSMIFFVASVPAVAVAIYYLKKPYILTLASMMQIIIVIIGNMILIPLFGRFGAAYSLILAYSLSLFLTIYLSILPFLKKKMV